MISFLLDTLLATGVLIALVLVLRRPVGRSCGAQCAYALWLLPLLRFVMPPILLPASFAPQGSAPETMVGAPPPDAVIAMVSPVPSAQAEFTTAAVAEPAASAALPWAEIVLAVWLGGAALFLAWRFVSYRRMRRDLLAEARPVGEAGKVRLVETPAVSAPVAFGLIDKVVALPMFFMALENREVRDLAIAHELAHHRGHDLAANIIAQPLLALHWFNPLAWMAWRAMRRDQEAACDARVMADSDRDERARYATVIAGFAAGPRLALAAPMACPVLGEKSIIHRLRSLNMDTISRRRRMLGRGLLLAGGLALPLSATVTYAASELPETQTETISAAATPDDGDPTTARHRMVIVDVRDGDDRDRVKLHTRTITRDGRTVVLRSDRELSDAEVNERVERAFRTAFADRVAPVPPVPPVAPVAPVAPMAPIPPVPAVPKIAFSWNGDHDVEFDKNFEKDMEEWGKKMEKWGEDYGEAYAANAEAYAAHAEAYAAAASASAPEVIESCAGNPREVVTTTKLKNGKTRMVICERVAERQALSGLRSARATIARDRNIDPDVRDEVLEELDEEIERIESNG